MRITLITGSAHRDGTSALMAGEFARGAGDAGHEVYRFDAGRAKVHPCTGCGHCGYGENPCVFQDDMERLNAHMLEADLIAIVSPVYYWGLSAQTKAVIDRWQPTVFSLQGGKRAVLMTTQASGEEWVVEPLRSWYGNLLRFMRWEDAGRINALGCATREQIEASDYPKLAYELGRSL